MGGYGLLCTLLRPILVLLEEKIGEEKVYPSLRCWGIIYTPEINKNAWPKCGHGGGGHIGPNLMSMIHDLKMYKNQNLS